MPCRLLPTLKVERIIAAMLSGSRKSPRAGVNLIVSCGKIVLPPARKHINWRVRDSESLDSQKMPKASKYEFLVSYL